MNGICVIRTKAIIVERCGWAPTLMLAATLGPLGRAQPAQLALGSQILYPRVIQGGVESIDAYVFNNAPFGASAGDYRITAAYGPGLANSFGFMYEGTQAANGGTVPTGPARFNLQTASFSPGTVPVAVTLTDRKPGGGSISQAGEFTVLAHAAPGLVFGGPVLPLSSSNVVKFQTQVAPVFGEAAPTGTEAPGGAFRPEMLGDPPGIPTAPLDLDYFTSFGSPNITTTLTPAFNLPSIDTPGTGEKFNIIVRAPADLPYDTTFITTFVVHYSDSDDLPGANAPGSQQAAFNVNVEIDGETANWTITTGVVIPDGSSTATLLAVAGGFLGVLRRLPIRARNA